MLKIKGGNRLRSFSETSSLVVGEVFLVFFPSIVVVAALVGLSAMRGWSWLSKFPYLFFDLRLYPLGVLLAFSPLLNSLIWVLIRDSSYAYWVKWGKGEVSSMQWISGSSSSISSPLIAVCKQNLGFDTTWCRSPFSPKGCVTSRSRIDQETESDSLSESLLDPKPTYTGPFSQDAGCMRPVGPLLSIVQTSTPNGH